MRVKPVTHRSQTAVLGRPPLLPLLRLEGRPELLFSVELVVFRRTLPRALLRFMLVEDGVAGADGVTDVTVGNRTFPDSDAAAAAVVSLCRLSVAILIPCLIKPLPNAF